MQWWPCKIDSGDSVRAQRGQSLTSGTWATRWMSGFISAMYIRGARLYIARFWNKKNRRLNFNWNTSEHLYIWDMWQINSTCNMTIFVWNLYRTSAVVCKSRILKTVRSCVSYKCQEQSIIDRCNGMPVSSHQKRPVSFIWITAASVKWNLSAVINCVHWLKLHPEAFKKTVLGKF